MGGEQCALRAGVHGSQDADIGGGSQLAAGGRGLRPGGESGRACVDIFSELGPRHFLGFGGAWAHRRDRGGSQVQRLGCRQDCGRMVRAPAGRCIGLPFQLLCSPKLFVSCTHINLLSLLVVVADFPGSLAMQGPKKLLLKNIMLIVCVIVAP
jgi:hypothetical protein